MNRNASAVVGTCVLLFGVCAHHAAKAGDQSAAPSPPTKAGNSDNAPGLEEIVVTAQKRSQSLLDVPIMITAITGDDLKAKEFDNITDLPDLIPGVRMNTPGGGSNAALSIRGIGQQDVGLHQEAPVATYVDGAYISLSTAIAQPIFDTERVEVLKGPQGTLFGRNATGGLIQFVSVAPSQDFNAYTNVEYGSFNKFKTEGAVGGGLNGDWSGRFSFHAESGGGYIKNTEGDAHDGVTAFAGRGQLLYSPSDRFSVLFSAYGLDWPNQPGPAPSTTRLMLNAAGIPVVPPSFAAYQGFCQGLIGSAPAQSGPLGNCFGAQSNPYTVTAPSGTTYQGQYWNGTITVNAKLAGDLNFTSITNYQRMRDNTTVLPLDIATGSNFLYTNRQPKADQVSEEARVAGVAGKAQWVAGVYGLWIDNHSGNDINLQGLPQYGVALSTQNYTETASAAAFSELTYSLTSQFDMIVGARITQDHKHGVNHSGCTTNPIIPVDVCGIIDSSSPVPLVAFDGYDLSFSKTSWSGRAVAQYKPEENVMLFLGVNRGTKSGGFNSGGAEFYPVSDAEFGAEVLTNYEGGIKSRFFDHRLAVDASVFYYDYRNYQTFSTVNAAQQVFNVNADIKGAEFSATARPVSHLEFASAVSYLDTEQRHVPNGNTFGDYPIPEAPKFSVNASGRYGIEMFGGEIWGQASYSYVGRRSDTAVAYEAEDIPAYSRVDLRIAYDRQDGKFSTAFNIRNLTNRVIYTSRVPFETLNGFSYDGVDSPRFYSVSITYRYR